MTGKDFANNWKNRNCANPIRRGIYAIKLKTFSGRPGRFIGLYQSQTMDNRPLSEQFYEAALDWSDKEAAASLKEDLKSSVLSQMMTKLGDIAVNKAEKEVKASQEWIDHVTTIVEARHEANKAKAYLEYIRMRFSQWQS